MLQIVTVQRVCTEHTFFCNKIHLLRDLFIRMYFPPSSVHIPSLKYETTSRLKYRYPTKNKDETDEDFHGLDGQGPCNRATPPLLLSQGILKK
jgi:hypothetical protein